MIIFWQNALKERNRNAKYSFKEVLLYRILCEVSYELAAGCRSFSSLQCSPVLLVLVEHMNTMAACMYIVIRAALALPQRSSRSSEQ